MTPISQCVDRTSSSEAKIALFRSLFRGRDDVYRSLACVAIDVDVRGAIHETC
jgi:hypothetical protein